MKIVLVHNKYTIRGGECIAFETTADILTRKGVSVSTLVRDSRDIGDSFLKKASALVSGIYSLSAPHEMERMIRNEQPDVVHVHNLYPLLSPSILVACQKAGVPVVMTCHNYRMVCPIGIHLYDGVVCERCCGGREYWCFLKNCRGTVFESFGYALRNIIARNRRLFLGNVTCYISAIEFLKRRLVDAGFPEELIFIVRNPVVIPDSGTDASRGEYIAYSGRISPEKGIHTLLAAAALNGLPLRLAGDYSETHGILETASANVRFVGLYNRESIDSFYRKARFLVVPSEWFEVSPLVITEAMAQGLSVIASRIGGISELVEDGTTGFLFEPGNAEDLADKMKRLWDDPALCRRMGEAGREKAIREYNGEVHFRDLMAVYQRAIAMKKGRLDK